jgi:hypothetical protein
MKLPRDLTGLQLVQILEVLDYQVTRQTGTLSAILNDVAQHFNISRDDLLNRLL